MRTLATTLTVPVALATALMLAPAGDAAGMSMQLLKAKHEKSTEVVRFFTGNRFGWMRAPRRDSCWSFAKGQRRRVCFIARRTLAHHRQALRWLKQTMAKRTRSVPSSYPPHYQQWLCIHRGEGAWNSNTGNGYYGGLQMDWSFMSSYGGSLLRTKGTADRWTPLEQMWVAERAYQSGRGFYPWPTTARACGLI